MAERIEDYGLIGDTQSAALVSRNGAIDWLCLPRFDSGALFAALLGTREHGRWSIHPHGDVRATRRRYRPSSLVLETEFETEHGVARVTDFMPVRERVPDVVRLVEGVRGRVDLSLELRIRFDYGSITPFIRAVEDGFVALAGPDALSFRTPVECAVDGGTITCDFSVTDRDALPFVLTWFPSHERIPEPIDPRRALTETDAWWREWCGACDYEGPWRDAVERSLITLKALTYGPTGGIVAAPTTSLPEQLGGVRNWDYRYCWVRDATFTLDALLSAGFTAEARAWRDWLLRAVAGDPEDFQLMYGPAGERRLPEVELEWLPGYERSSPVRIGNAASRQLQLDVYGELMDALHQSRRAGIDAEPEAWDLQCALLDWLESGWRQPDCGIWEMRGEPRHFTHSKVMAWVAFDRAVEAVERFGLDGPVERWQRAAREVHAEVCEKGYDDVRNTFVQSYGSPLLDASLLMIPLVGFLPATDARVAGTVDAIQRELSHDGLLLRYREGSGVDVLPPGEGAFLPCSFWLADNLALLGRHDEARTLFERLLGVCNDLGLIAEEFDPTLGRLLGNFPQALTHVALVNTAYNLSERSCDSETAAAEE